MSQAIVEDHLHLSNTSDTAEIGGRIEQIPVSAAFEETRRIFERDGIVCLTDAIAPDLVADTVEVLDSLMASTDMEHFFTGKNDKASESILGVLTKRRSEILATAPDLLAEFLTQPRLIELVKGRLTEFATSILYHQVMGLEVHPGEIDQPLHRDNVLWPIPGHRIPMGVGLMIPLEDFTRDTGASRVILGSHLWPEARYIDPKDVAERLTGGKRWKEYGAPSTLEPEMESIAEVPPGSLVVWDGELLHGGGANTTQDRVRKSLLCGICVGWLRGETNQQLMWPPEVARDFPRELQRLIGYDIEGSILGCIQIGQDPITLLEAP